MDFDSHTIEKCINWTNIVNLLVKHFVVVGLEPCWRGSSPASPALDLDTGLISTGLGKKLVWFTELLCL